jgi:hypothetical protein
VISEKRTDADDEAGDLEGEVVASFVVKVGPLPRRDPVEPDGPHSYGRSSIVS